MKIHSNVSRCIYLKFAHFLCFRLPIGVCAAGVFGYIWLYILEQPDSVAIPHYDIGVYCFAGSALIELLAEPLWISGQIYLFVRTKVGK